MVQWSCKMIKREGLAKGEKQRENGGDHKRSTKTHQNAMNVRYKCMAGICGEMRMRRPRWGCCECLFLGMWITYQMQTTRKYDPYYQMKNPEIANDDPFHYVSLQMKYNGVRETINNTVEIMLSSFTSNYSSNSTNSSSSSSPWLVRGWRKESFGRSLEEISWQRQMGYTWVCFDCCGVVLRWLGVRISSKLSHPRQITGIRFAEATQSSMHMFQQSLSKWRTSMVEVTNNSTSYNTISSTYAYIWFHYTIARKSLSLSIPSGFWSQEFNISEITIKSRFTISICDRPSETGVRSCKVDILWTDICLWVNILWFDIRWRCKWHLTLISINQFSTAYRFNRIKRDTIFYYFPQLLLCHRIAMDSDRYIPFHITSSQVTSKFISIYEDIVYHTNDCQSNNVNITIVMHFITQLVNYILPIQILRIARVDLVDDSPGNGNWLRLWQDWKRGRSSEHSMCRARVIEWRVMDRICLLWFHNPRRNGKKKREEVGGGGNEAKESFHEARSRIIRLKKMKFVGRREKDDSRMVWQVFREDSQLVEENKIKESERGRAEHDVGRRTGEWFRKCIKRTLGS